MLNMTLESLVALMDRGSRLYLWDDRHAEEEELTPYDVARMGHRRVKRIAFLGETKTLIYLQEEAAAPSIPSPYHCCCG